MYLHFKFFASARYLEIEPLLSIQYFFYHSSVTRDNITLSSRALLHFAPTITQFFLCDMLRKFKQLRLIFLYGEINKCKQRKSNQIKLNGYYFDCSSTCDCYHLDLVLCARQPRTEINYLLMYNLHVQQSFLCRLNCVTLYLYKINQKFGSQGRLALSTAMLDVVLLLCTISKPKKIASQSAPEFILHAHHHVYLLWNTGITQVPQSSKFRLIINFPFFFLI